MPGAPTVARIFIISEPAIYRDGLRVLLAAEPGFRVVGAAADYVRALQAARKAGADIIVLDLARPLSSGSGMLSALAGACAPARIIMLVPSLDKNQLLEALLNGVSGVLMKDVSSEVLFRSIRAVAAGQCWVGPEEVADLIQSLSEMAQFAGPTPSSQQSFGLSARELGIVEALAAGCMNKEIAQRCRISEKTVKHHLTHIFKKLRLSNRLEVALFALHHGLVIRGPESASRDSARRSVRTPKIPQS